MSVIKYSREKSMNIKLETYYPSIDLDTDQRVTFFTVREIASGLTDEHGQKFDVKLTIDYYDMEQLNGHDASEFQEMERDLSLPFGAGCSEFVEPKISPNSPVQSFIMSYYQASVQSPLTLAYDSDRGYLRRELYSRGFVSIWDLNENLLYSLDTHSSTASMVDVESSASLDNPLTGNPQASAVACSVLRVDDPSLGFAQRPVAVISDGQEGKPMDIFNFLGAKSLAYMGRSMVRDMFCSVYEVIVDQPPPVFARNVDLEDRHKGSFDYIVQFYLLRTGTVFEDKNLATKEFWPARINLIKRHKSSGVMVKTYDSLEISDFHWGLFGLPLKPSELFMAPECFDLDDEQVKVELLLDFKLNGHKIRATGAEQLNALRENRYQLELEITNDLFRTFGISRLHLTDFELTLRLNDAMVNLVVSDRNDDKKLVYSGRGDLSGRSNSGQQSDDNTILLTGAQDEESCVTLASHITGVTMAVWYPYVSNSNEKPTCYAVLGNTVPIVKTVANASSSAKATSPFEEPAGLGGHVYRFEEAQPPAGATQRWTEWRDLLHDYEFSFLARVGDGPRDTYTVMVQSFELDKKMSLLTVHNYKYSLSSNDLDHEPPATPKVRAFTQMSYNNLGDCARMCNLDVTCKSYSYCAKLPKTKTPADQVSIQEEERCLLSSLDIRESSVNEQLLTAQLVNNTVTIRDLRMGGTGKYHLDLTRSCVIHEKDYLDSYSETGERLTMPSSDAHKFQTSSSATECAKFALDVEGKQDYVVSHTIAYCPDTQVCLLDSNLFATVKEAQQANLAQQEDAEFAQDEGDSATAINREPISTCLVYRRKYQTFFHVTQQVLRRPKIGDKLEDAVRMQSMFDQIPLELGTVEECARACWNQFGQVCASFDYCSSESLCLINSIAVNDTNTGDDSLQQQTVNDKLAKLVEKRMGCLHYERDLRLDQIRKKHAALRHTELDLSIVKPARETSGVNFFLKIILFCWVSASFLSGLIIGKVIDERLDRRSPMLLLPGSNGVANFINNLVNVSRGSFSGRGNAGSNDGDTAALSEHDLNQTNQMELEEFRSAKSKDISSDELRNEPDSANILGDI